MSLEYPCEFVLEVKKDCRVVGEILIQIGGMSYSPTSNQMEADLWATNLRPYDDEIKTISTRV